MLQRVRPEFVGGMFVMLAVGCSAAVMPGDGGDASRDAMGGSDVVSDTPMGSDVVGCRLPNGMICPVGQSCPAGDGCNTCSCQSPGGFAQCTLRACVDAQVPDATPTGCRTNADCVGRGQCLYFTAGCGVLGTCSTAACPPSIGTFCGCDGRTFMTPSACADRPFASSGSCGSMGDAGATCPDTSHVDPSTGACVDGAGRMVSAACCTYSCDPLAVLCNALPPTCAPGEGPSVRDRCWGPCVPIGQCTCNPALSRPTCPPGAFCDPTTMRCRRGG